MNYLVSMAVDLNKRYVQPITMPDVLLVPGENRGHKWAIEVLENGEPSNLIGYTVYADFQRADGFIHKVPGSVADNVASVVFDKALYAIPGLLRGQFFISKSNEVIALVEAWFNVRMDISGNAVLSLGEIIYYADEGRIAWNGADFFDVSATTAVETDVRDGKAFFRADGALVEGDASFEATITGGTVTATQISGDDYALTIS